MRQQISAIERLQSLPPIFRGGDLTTRFQWTSKTASHYLYLWKNRRLVAGLGGHSDVFANLLTTPVANWEKALIMAMPSAVMIGVEALRLAGWTTQIPRRPTVAVNARHRVFTTKFFEVMPRAPAWFAVIGKGVLKDRATGLPVLRPAWALADLLCAQGWGKCGLFPDDIHWDQIVAADEADWLVACAAFELPCVPLCEQVVYAR